MDPLYGLFLKQTFVRKHAAFDCGYHNFRYQFAAPRHALEIDESIVQANRLSPNQS